VVNPDDMKGKEKMVRSLSCSLLALCLVGVTLVARPAQAASKKPAAHHTAAKASYVCPKCHIISQTAGKCPHCHVAMVRRTTAVAAYECTMCNIKSTKAGSCPMCGMTMTKVGAKSHKI
jgi:hypothetical protein